MDKLLVQMVYQQKLLKPTLTPQLNYCTGYLAESGETKKKNTTDCRKDIDVLTAVKLPKKVDLHECKSFRGMLLTVPGKNVRQDHVGEI